MVNCTVPSHAQSVTQFADKTFANVLTASSDYKKSLRNNWVYYNPSAALEPDPTTVYSGVPYPYEFKRVGRMMSRWYAKAHSIPATDAVIVIHGSTSLPDLWFADSQVSQSWGEDYLHHGGTVIYNEGYDVFAPYVTHVAKGDHPHTLDLNRCLALYDELKSRGYARIHLVGISYGAQLVGHLVRSLRDDDCRGMSLAIEGWLPETAYIRVPDASALFLWNWENMFGNGQSDAVFRDLPDRTYLAHGSCAITRNPMHPGLPDLYTDIYATLPQEKVIFYDGAHEYRHDAFLEAMARAYP
jgi:hypothetical protein